MAGKGSRQESMIVINEHMALLEVRDFSAPEAAVNLIEQKIHLINCLGYLAGAKMLEGVVTIGPDDGKILDRYGVEATSVVIASDRKRVNNLERAKWEFAWASGRFALQDSGLMGGTEARALSAGMFSDFLKKYYLPNERDVKRERRSTDEEYELTSHEFREKLEAEVHQLQTSRTEYNQKYELRPYKPASKTITETDQSAGGDKELSFLDTKQKLEALMEDPRAGFVPSTHREKNLVMTFLDYLDNPDYPLGINNQFFEVMVHQQKYEKGRPARGKTEAVRAVESIVWEIGDYLASAASSIKLLQELQLELRGCSPKVSLADEVTEDQPGLAQLARYMNLREYLKAGKITGLNRDPLRTAEERWAEGNESGKHKIIHDQYTRPDRTTVFEKYMKRYPASVTIGEAMQALAEAIANETKRANFMAQRLLDSGILDQYLTMQPVSEAVKVSLGVLQEVA